MPATSHLGEVEVPQTDLWTFLFERKDRQFPDDKVIARDAFTNRSYTYAQTKDAAAALGNGLKSQWEWKKGEVLALFSPNSVDSPAVMFGVFWAGGVVTTANPGYTAEEFAFQLENSGATAIATQLPILKTALEAAKKVGIPDDRVILLGDERDPSHKFKHFTSIRNTSGASRYRRTKRSPDDLAFLPYSSGTTGKPKGVMLNHRNVATNVLMNQSIEGKQLTWQNDKILAFLPFFHIYGLTVLLHQSYYAGYEMVVMPKFDLESFCKVIQDHKVTMAYVVPPVVLGLSKHPIVEKYNLKSLRMMMSGAAPLTKELVKDCYSRIQVPVRQGYGLSETSPTTHVQPWERWDTAIGSVGVLLPTLTAKFMSAEEKELPVGQTGELWVKGPSVFPGYLKNEEGTRNSITADGFFKTGDVGYQDKDGNFYITDRVKELIKYKGFQVPPAELEGVLLSHPKINDVAVIGIQDDAQATEVPRAYIVVKPGTSKDESTGKEIQTWLAQKVANHKQLRGGVRFVDEIPKSATGKILRRVLKEQALKEGPPKAKL